MGNNKLATTPHFPILDGLRGVAALIVVCFHFCEPLATSHLTQIVNHSYLAVDFFCGNCSWLLLLYIHSYLFHYQWTLEDGRICKFLGDLSYPLYMVHSCEYLNNRIKADYRLIKWRNRYMLGITSFESTHKNTNRYWNGEHDRERNKSTFLLIINAADRPFSFSADYNQLNKINGNTYMYYK